MATDFNPLLNLFRIESTKGTTQTQSAEKVGSDNNKIKAAEKVGSGNNKEKSIFNAAGMSGLEEGAIGDSFERRTQTPQAQADTRTTDKTTSPIGKAQKGNALNINSDQATATKSNPTKGFGSLSSSNNVEDKKDDKEEKSKNTGFGSLAMGYTGSSTFNNNSEIKELAEELDCEATESAVKEKIQGMSADELVKLDSKFLEMAKDLNFISMRDIEDKTGVTAKDIEAQNKKASKKIKFGTMTSGDMV